MLTCRPLMCIRYAAILPLLLAIGCGNNTNTASSSANAPAPAAYGSLDRAFAPLNETAGEIAAYRAQEAGEDSAVLNAALTEAFGTTAPGCTETTAIMLLRYVSQALKLESASARTGAEYLAQGKGFCTGFAMAFVALCRQAGFAARMNGFTNLELMQGHNTAEVYYEGAWHFFDPTFGTFFYTQASYGGDGRIPPLRELMASPEIKRFCFRTAETLWAGKYSAGGETRAIPDDFLREKYGYSLQEFYTTLFSHAFPLTPGRESAVSQPVDVDLRNGGVFWAGAVDGSEQDLFGERKNGRFERFRAATHLGKTRYATIFHTFTLRTPGPGRYRLVYHFFGGKHERLGVVELRNVIAGGSTSDEKTWALEFFVQGNEASFLVANRDGQAYVDAIQVTHCGDPAPAGGAQ